MHKAPGVQPEPRVQYGRALPKACPQCLIAQDDHGHLTRSLLAAALLKLLISISRTLMLCSDIREGTHKLQSSNISTLEKGPFKLNIRGWVFPESGVSFPLKFNRS